MKYELINPSDEIYFDAESREVALFCVVSISEGYAAKNCETGETTPFYLFGATKEALESELGRDIETFIELNRDEINLCWRSFRYVRKRTSMNQIVDYAHSLRLSA